MFLHFLTSMEAMWRGSPLSNSWGPMSVLVSEHNSGEEGSAATSLPESAQKEQTYLYIYILFLFLSCDAPSVAAIPISLHRRLYNDNTFYLMEKHFTRNHWMSSLHSAGLSYLCSTSGMCKACSADV